MITSHFAPVAQFGPLVLHTHWYVYTLILQKATWVTLYRSRRWIAVSGHAGCAQVRLTPRAIHSLITHSLPWAKNGSALHDSAPVRYVHTLMVCYIPHLIPGTFLIKLRPPRCSDSLIPLVSTSPRSPHYSHSPLFSLISYTFCCWAFDRW